MSKIINPYEEWYYTFRDPICNEDALPIATDWLTDRGLEDGVFREYLASLGQEVKIELPPKEWMQVKIKKFNREYGRTFIGPFASVLAFDIPIVEQKYWQYSLRHTISLHINNCLYFQRLHAKGLFKQVRLLTLIGYLYGSILDIAELPVVRKIWLHSEYGGYKQTQAFLENNKIAKSCELYINGIHIATK